MELIPLHGADRELLHFYVLHKGKAIIVLPSTSSEGPRRVRLTDFITIGT